MQERARRAIMGSKASCDPEVPEGSRPRLTHRLTQDASISSEARAASRTRESPAIRGRASCAVRTASTHASSSPLGSWEAASSFA